MRPNTLPRRIARGNSNQRVGRGVKFLAIVGVMASAEPKPVVIYSYIEALPSTGSMGRSLLRLKAF